jgi:hypothetical protein
MSFYKNIDIDDLPNEVWIDVLGYEARYMVSNYGRVKSCQFTQVYINKLGKKVKSIFKAVILKQYDSVGYLKVDLYRDSKRGYLL